MKVIYFVIFFIIGMSFKANSCSCAFKPSFEQAVKDAEYIFSCMILAVEKRCYQASDSTWREITEEEGKQEKWFNVLCYFRYKVKMLEVFKNNIETEELFVQTLIGGSMCEFPFK